MNRTYSLEYIMQLMAVENNLIITLGSPSYKRFVFNFCNHTLECRKHKFSSVILETIKLDNKKLSKLCVISVLNKPTNNQFPYQKSFHTARKTSKIFIL